MSQAPKLPANISSNGIEIWDWAATFSNHVHLQDKKRKLRRKVSAPLVCGDCQHWMKSRDCPKEHNVNGMSKGPSCNGDICGTFSESQESLKRHAAAQTELDELLAEIDERTQS